MNKVNIVDIRDIMDIMDVIYLEFRNKLVKGTLQIVY